MFSLTNLTVSLPNLLREFATHGPLSNLKINFTKSEAMGGGIPPLQLTHLQSCFKLKWTDMALKYLGTYIPQKFSRLYEPNFPPLLKTIKTLLNQWHMSLHSWLGRCNFLEMTILPKFLNLTQALPIHIPISYFKQVQSVFMGQKKDPGLPINYLSSPNIMGALHYRIFRPTTWGDL